MLMRFTASDSTIASLPNNGQSIVEAAMDEFQVWDGPLTATGINSSDVSGLTFDVYPNPSNGKFTVQNSLFKIQSIVVYNVLGEMVLDLPVNQSTNLPAGQAGQLINLSSQPAGMYQLRIKTNEGTVTKKISVVK